MSQKEIIYKKVLKYLSYILVTKILYNYYNYNKDTNLILFIIFFVAIYIISKKNFELSVISTFVISKIMKKSDENFNNNTFFIRNGENIVTNQILPTRVYYGWYWDKNNKKYVHSSVHEPFRGKYANGGVDIDWNRLYIGKFSKPSFVKKITLEGLFNDQGWGNNGGGSIFAVGLNKNKRSWVISLLKNNNSNSRNYNAKWVEKWTYSKKDVDFDNYEYTDIENNFMKCKKSLGLHGRLPGNCTINSAPKLADRIEIWFFNKYGNGQYGYIKNVKFNIEFEPV